MASSSTTNKKSVNKATVITYAFTFDSSGSAPSTVFQIPNETSAVCLQVGIQGTEQTIALQGSNDGVTFATITNGSKKSGAAAGVSVLARSVIGYFPFYRLNNDTATATVTASLSFTLA